MHAKSHAQREALLLLPGSYFVLYSVIQLLQVRSLERNPYPRCLSYHVSKFSNDHWVRLSTTARLTLETFSLSTYSPERSTKQIVQYDWGPMTESQQTQQRESAAPCACSCTQAHTLQDRVNRIFNQLRPHSNQLGTHKAHVVHVQCMAELPGAPAGGTGQNSMCCDPWLLRLHYVRLRSAIQSSAAVAIHLICSHDPFRPSFLLL
jgi:hypothetical protein